MADLFTGIVRFLHITAGVTMVGGIFLWSLVIAPGVSKHLPPQVRGPFMARFIPIVSKYLTYAGVVTLLTGFWVMGLITGFGNIVPAFQKTSWGMALGAGFVALVAMLGIAGAIIQPTARHMLALGAQATSAPPGSPPPPEMAGLQKRLMMASLLNVLLAVVALATMAAAVNIRT